jgi:hypothetical protein
VLVLVRSKLVLVLARSKLVLVLARSKLVLVLVRSILAQEHSMRSLHDGPSAWQTSHRHTRDVT